MTVNTADAYTGELVASTDCSEGVLEWVKKSSIKELDIWEGDKVFFELLDKNSDFFSLKLSYKGSKLVGAVLDGKTLEK